MKKTIFISALVLAAAISTVVYSQSSPETMSRVRDATTQTNVANVTQLGASMPIANYGLNTAAGCYYVRGGQWYSWTGTAAGADNVANATPAPYVYNLSMVYDSGTGTWDRMTQPSGGATVALGDAMGATPSGVASASYNTYFDGANFRRWNGGTLTDNYTQPVLPYSANFQMVWDGAKWDRMTQPTGNTPAAVSDAMGAFPLGVWSVGINTFFDGTNYRRWRGEPWDAALAITTNPNVNAFGVYWDGTQATRLVGEAWDTTIENTNAPETIALNAFHDTVSGKGYRWYGEPLDAAISATVPTAPFVGAYNLYWDGTGIARWPGEAWDVNIAAGNAPTTIALNAFRDATSSTNMWWTGALWSADMAVTAAPNVNALTTWRDTTNSKNSQWTGESIDDGMTAAPLAPWTAAYQVFGSLDAAESRRATGETWDTDMVAGPVSMNTNAHGVFYNIDSSKGYRATGETWDSDMTAAPVNPSVNAYATFYNGSKGQYWQGSVLSAETTANTTYAPHAKNYNYCYDATSSSWRWVNVIDAQADGQASTLNGQVTSAFGYGFNGSTWDMLRVGASNELQVTDVATRAGEDVANDYVKTKKEQTATYSPSYIDTDMTASVETTIFGPLEVLSDVNFCIYIKNIDDSGSQAFTDVDVYISPNNSDFIDMNWSDCDTLAFGSLCNYCVSGNAFRYLKITATSGSDNYARVWYTSNKN